MVSKYLEGLTWPSIDLMPMLDPVLKIGVMASGRGSNFEALVKATLDNTLNAQVECLIVNKEECGARLIADRYNIPCYFFDHRKYEKREDLDKKIIEVLSLYKIEGVVMAGWMRIVTPVLINKFPDRLINIHPSLLPSFKGNRAIKQSLESNVKITGCTVHLVREAVDTGPILIQTAIPVFSDDNEETLQRRMQIEEHKILINGVAIAASRWRETNQG